MTQTHNSPGHVIYKCHNFYTVAPNFYVLEKVALWLLMELEDARAYEYAYRFD
jgi:hypothetical protein